MNKRWDVLGLGAVAVDDLVYLDGYPGPDSKMPIADEQRQAGGLAGTALVAAARLGVRAAYLGVLGDNELSRFTLAEFAREGVDSTPVSHQSDARPVHSVIIVNRQTGERTILYSWAGVIPPDPARLDPEVIAACRVLFVDSTVTQTALVATALARSCGVAVVADLEHATATGAPELVSAVDHLIVGLTFARQMTGATDPVDMVRRLWQASHAACVVTAGDRGCWYLSRETGTEVQYHPALEVRAVDTTGCGDVFHGAYAASLARGLPIAQAIAAATVAAGLKATRPGGRSGIPDWATVTRVLQEQGVPI